MAVPLLVATHRSHDAVRRWWDGQEVALCGHALAETYSVLTRLPGDLRLAPADASRLLADRFVEPFLLGADTARRAPEVLSGLGIAGGAVYDALVALTALEHGAVLATRDARARDTYETCRGPGHRRCVIAILGSRAGTNSSRLPQAGLAIGEGWLVER